MIKKHGIFAAQMSLVFPCILHRFKLGSISENGPPGAVPKIRRLDFPSFLEVRLLLPVTTDSYENDDNADSKNLFFKNS